jgi:hypothetical protein
VNNNNTTIKIKSIHNNVADAVAAANLDLSYNPRTAREDIADLDNPTSCPDIKRKPVTKAYVTENNEVYYIFECDITLLNKLELFSSCINDSPFSLVVIDEANNEINITRPILKKCDESRKFAKISNWILTSR